MGVVDFTRRSIFNDDHRAFRELVADFLAKEVVPDFPEWEDDGLVPRDLYRKAGDVGILGVQVPEEFGGGGQDSFLFNAVLIEETFRAGVGLGGMRVHMDIVLPYLLHYASPEQRGRWLCGMASGEIMTALAMTEPGTGSDLASIMTSARRDGDHYVVNGAKTFISGGANADLVFVVCRTDSTPSAGRHSSHSIIAIEKSREGFSVGRKLKKLGLRAQDTTELFFTDVRVPVTNLLGAEGEAFTYLTHNLAQERLTIALGAQAAAAAALRTTVEYVKSRMVFGKPLSTMQNTRFTLAQCSTQIQAAQVMCDQALKAHDAGELTVTDAARLKLFCTEVQGRVVDECLQLHGGYGYVLEYPIARMYADARVSRIHGGTSEIMKTIIAKDLGL